MPQEADPTLEIAQATTTVWTKVTGWIEAAIAMLPNFVVAVLVVIAFVVVAKIIRRILRRVLATVVQNPQVSRLLQTVVYVSVVTIGFFVALSVLNLDDAVTSLLAGVGILGLALGFAFQDIAANFVSGILLAIRRPFQEGEMIETGGVTGVVQEVNLRSTIMRTGDGQIVLVPNKDVFGTAITNIYGSGERRVDILCGVSYNDDLEKAKNVALEAMKGVPGRDESQEPAFFYTGFGGSSIDFVVNFWTKNSGDHGAFLKAQSDAIMALKAAFDEAGVDIPFPIRTLDAGDSLKELFEARA
ncbi:MAG: mechanosensitive ion channel family protein [Rhodothermales bacterium]|nr:mechanosensitive ion channel family protein [Rhodothermales bacterium]